ncbi:MAG: glycosyltransferase [Candidatus Levybacteria bacterium]|nr:glycosyltransferase [Candidatus Levybacteria bacterium]
MKISIVVPNYNGVKLIKENLPLVVSSLVYFRNKTNHNVELVVVDDASSDESVEFLNYFQNRTKAIDVIIEVNKINKGFSPTVNIGVKKSTGDIVVLLNSDVIPSEDFLIPLVKHFSNENIFAAACMDKSIEDGKTVLRGRGVGHWKNGFLAHKMGDLEKKNTLWASGGSSAFSKKIWNKIGGLCELYAPYYWEDIDLSYRALKCGFEVVFEKESIVIHKHEEGSIKKSQSKQKVNKIVNRNQHIFTLLNATDKKILVEYIINFPLFFLRGIKNKDTSYLSGTFMMIAILPQILSARKTFQHMMRKSDAEIISSFDN